MIFLLQQKEKREVQTSHHLKNKRMIMNIMYYVAVADKVKELIEKNA